MATITEIAGTKQQKKVLRTAAYCRVSSDSLDQLHSFAAQVQHYTKTISQNPNMELADIYADEGLTGTKTDMAMHQPIGLRHEILQKFTVN